MEPQKIKKYATLSHSGFLGSPLVTVHGLMAMNWLQTRKEKIRDKTFEKVNDAQSYWLRMYF